MKRTHRSILTVAAVVLATFNLPAATLYVSLQSTNPVAPFATWDTAATVIQNAVDAARNGDTVLVTNGVYATGGREQYNSSSNWVGNSRVTITNSIRLESVNGPAVTAIMGDLVWNGEFNYADGTNRCVYLGGYAVLSGFTLTNGFARNGGGVYCEASAVVTNCSLVGNFSTGVYAGNSGGGAYGGTLNNCMVVGNKVMAGGAGACSATLNGCTLMDNTAFGWPDSHHSGGGGGVQSCLLNNCTLTGNSGRWGGGASLSTLYNCTLTGNSALGGGGATDCTLYNCALTGNRALADRPLLYGKGGGGAENCTLYNCTLIGNHAENVGGGASGGTLWNCIVYYNTAASGPNCVQDPWSGPISYSCTTPLPTNGIGNITGPPLFMDMAAGNYRLWEGSPCIDRGTNLLGISGTLTNIWRPASSFAYNHHPTDILGNTRFIDGNGDGIVAWDIGAYEFNSFKPPRFIGAPQRTAEGWKLSITGEPNKWTRAQRTSDLRDWWDIWSGFMPADGLKQIIDTEANEMMFYRAVVP